MYYHLSSQSTVSRKKFRREAWAKVLSLAMLYGWQPMGTHPGSRIEVYGLDPEDWDGTYLTNDGQVVIAEDALSLAMALEKALDDIPDFNIELDRAPKSQEDEDRLPEWLLPEEGIIIEEGSKEQQLNSPEIHPFEYFAGDEKRHLIDFIKFCQLGSFTILRI
ncbi:MAG TPA: hypothetical protein VJM08_01235 [Anaerolineales bacterium]|nr:hypothetical protein [Anaerolineales bacterium]